MLSLETQRDEFVAAMSSRLPFEIDAESWYYWLEVLPPVYMGRTVKLPSGKTVRASFGFAEGEEAITAFWEHDGRYYACGTDEINRPW